MPSSIPPAALAAPPISRPPAAPTVPVAVQVLDRLGEIVAVCWAGWLCARGRTSFEFFAGFSALVLGIQTGIRNVGQAKISPTVGGAVSLVVALAGSHLLHRVVTLTSLTLLLGTSLAGCPPILGPVANCEATRFACRDNRPYRCSDSRRWAPLAATCAPGSTCREGVPGLLHPDLAACMPDADGGAQ